MTWVPTYAIGGFGGPPNTYYVRVSCAVYNEVSDYVALANAIVTLLGTPV